jgi:hypothetical protein
MQLTKTNHMMIRVITCVKNITVAYFPIATTAIGQVYVGTEFKVM